MDVAYSTDECPSAFRNLDKMEHSMELAVVTQAVRKSPCSCDALFEANRPQRALGPAQEPSHNANARVEPRTTYSVLIVEDDPDITMTLQDLLEFQGFHVECAQTCRQAFSSIERNVYNAVLLDLGLPDGDGCSVLEKLQVSHPSLPVIVLTASNRDLGPLRAYARLTKPWKREELCGILRRAVGGALS